MSPRFFKVRVARTIVSHDEVEIDVIAATPEAADKAIRSIAMVADGGFRLHPVGERTVSAIKFMGPIKEEFKGRT